MTTEDDVEEEPWRFSACNGCFVVVILQQLYMEIRKANCNGDLPGKRNCRHPPSSLVE